VDLPAHGAQVETLALWLKGDAAVRATYDITFPVGYGLIFWLVLPLAWLWNGAVAVRCGLALTLFLFPLSVCALLRVHRRSLWPAVLSLPLAFNISYWYGLLPGLFAQPMAIFALAAFALSLQKPTARALLLVNVLAAATMLSHLVAFVALAWAMGVVALASVPWKRAVGVGFASLGLPALLSMPKVLSMANRAVTSGDWPPTEYAAMSHVNWFFRNYRPEGVLGVVVPLLVTAGFSVVWWRRRKEEPRGPMALFLALAVLYLITPKTLSGIYLISVRLPVLAGMVALCVVDARAIPLWFRNLCLAGVLLSLGETAVFHHRFRSAMTGLETMLEGPPPGRNGYLSLEGREIFDSRQIYLEHVGQWLTATRGGVGHNFFTDAEHHPVRNRPGQELPYALEHAPPEAFGTFDTILVYAKPGRTLPAPLDTWNLRAHQGDWWRFERPR
jgi:hypothetical protein